MDSLSSGSSDITVRASDSDRERIATLLRDNYTDGRLTFDELQERLEQAYASKTVGELQVLTSDLPAHTASAAPVTGARGGAGAPGQAAIGSPIVKRVLTYVVLMVFLVGIWVATGGNGSFWPIWPMLVGGLILAFDLLGLRGPESNRHQMRDARRAARNQARAAAYDALSRRNRDRDER